jgi:superfamily II DNA or RNA helicase
MPSPDPVASVAAGVDAKPELSLRFLAGTVEVRALDGKPPPALPGCAWDERTACLRAPAHAYAAIVRTLVRDKIPYADEARGYETLEHGVEVRRAPRPYQQEALDAWTRAGGRGVVVLPTGSGKTQVAVMAIDAKRRSALVVAPTLDLVAQWVGLLKAAFRADVGVVGGGEYRLAPLTVITYDSAMIHMENLGARFGIIVFDECHHLPGEGYRIAAEACLAPYRMGLTATPPGRDSAQASLEELVGPVVYRKDITELAGEYLAEYTVETILVDLTADERQAYETARAVYRDFVRGHGISMSAPDGWSRFVIESSMSAAGRRAMQAYLEQKHLAFAAPSKLAYVEHLLHRHRRDRVLLFTDRNSTAYELSSRLLVPAITHQTGVSERIEILEGFAQGAYNAIATSRVLNEGIDLPSANVGVVISGSGSVREHVQRLGRILRKVEGKQAVLYELVANDTAEMYTSTRRRDHDAYS